jgi:hypothetical protein
MTEPMRCPHSGLILLSCKVSDICDCFEFPAAEARAAEVLRNRDQE